VEPFKFSRQTIAFLCVLAAVEIAIVLIFPVVAVLLGVLATALQLFVWLKTGIRSGKWLWWNPAAVPLTQMEGALALSAALMFSVGVLEAGYEASRLAVGTKVVLSGLIWPYLETGRMPSSDPNEPHSVSYGDPESQQRLKDELKKAAIPYTVETIGGNEFVAWTREHNAAVEEIQRKIEYEFTAGHNISFDDAKLQQEFVDWLKKRGIVSDIVTRGGKKWVVWTKGPDDLVRQFMKETSPCPRPKAEKAKPC